jgi:hypothetical protein
MAFAISNVFPQFASGCQVFISKLFTTAEKSYFIPGTEFSFMNGPVARRVTR